MWNTHIYMRGVHHKQQCTIIITFILKKYIRNEKASDCRNSNNNICGEIKGRKKGKEYEDKLRRVLSAFLVDSFLLLKLIRSKNPHPRKLR